MDYRLSLIRQYRRYGEVYVRVGNRERRTYVSADGRIAQWTCRANSRNGYTSSTKFACHLLWESDGRPVPSKMLATMTMMEPVHQ